MVSSFSLSGVQFSEGIDQWINELLNKEKEVWVAAFYFKKVVDIDV